MRRLIGRAAAWLAQWANHGAQLHVCTRAYNEFLGVRTPATVFMELRPGDACMYCGETNRWPR